MNIKPILFSTQMVKSIREGIKSQTRRVAKDVPNRNHFGTNIMDWELSEHPHLKDGKWMYSVQTDVDDFATYELKPKYSVCDVLWVRETWQKVDTYPEPDVFGKYLYKSMGDTCEKWRPSIFMPKEACRIWLEITDVRVERLQDISEEDAKAEGVEPTAYTSTVFKSYDGYKHYMPDEETRPCKTAKHSFFTLWQSINGYESWEDNPFVWAISFKQVDKPENF